MRAHRGFNVPFPVAGEGGCLPMYLLAICVSLMKSLSKRVVFPLSAVDEALCIINTLVAFVLCHVSP